MVSRSRRRAGSHGRALLLLVLAALVALVTSGALVGSVCGLTHSGPRMRVERHLCDTTTDTLSVSDLIDWSVPWYGGGGRVRINMAGGTGFLSHKTIALSALNGMSNCAYTFRNLAVDVTNVGGDVTRIDVICTGANADDRWGELEFNLFDSIAVHCGNGVASGSLVVRTCDNVNDTGCSVIRVPIDVPAIDFQTNLRTGSNVLSIPGTYLLLDSSTIEIQDGIGASDSISCSADLGACVPNETNISIIGPSASLHTNIAVGNMHCDQNAPVSTGVIRQACYSCTVAGSTHGRCAPFFITTAVLQTENISPTFAISAPFSLTGLAVAFAPVLDDVVMDFGDAMCNLTLSFDATLYSSLAVIFPEPLTFVNDTLGQALTVRGPCDMLVKHVLVEKSGIQLGSVACGVDVIVPYTIGYGDVHIWAGSVTWSVTCNVGDVVWGCG